MLAEQVLERAGDGSPAFGKVRLGMPVDVGERLLYADHRHPAGSAQQPVVVLAVAAGDGLVHQADPVDQVAAEQERRRVQCSHPLAHELPDRHGGRRDTVHDPVGVMDPHAARRELGSRRFQALDL